MSLFGAIVRTVVNTVALPVAVVKDVVTLGNVTNPQTYTSKAIDTLKREAEDD